MGFMMFFIMLPIVVFVGVAIPAMVSFEEKMKKRNACLERIAISLEALVEQQTATRVIKPGQ